MLPGSIGSSAHCSRAQIFEKHRIKNLLFCGQLTVPGPGVPPAIISGGIVAKEVKKEIKS